MNPAVTQGLHSTTEAARLAGLTVRQVNYWALKGWATPSHVLGYRNRIDPWAPGRGTGRPWLYDDEALARLERMAALVADGYRVAAAGRIVQGGTP